MKKGEDYIGITVVYLCHDGNGKYLLNKRGMNCRDEQGRWDCGGGGVELHDTVEHTLVKEIKEEYGTDARSFEFLGYRDLHRKHEGRKTHWIALDFKVLVDAKQAKNGEPHKFDTVEWFALADFPSPLHSQFPHFLEKYKDRL